MSDIKDNQDKVESKQEDKTKVKKKRKKRRKKKNKKQDKTNREYKDRLFKFIFGNPENKEWTLSLYNAINNTSYSNADDIQITTIQDAVYMKMKNDVSFLVNNIMNFYEQQSTFNPNMPMRFLIYSGMIYSKYIENTKEYHEFSSVQQKAPAPQCICFYNGTSDKDDRMILKLSDDFEPDSRSDIEVYVTMININHGHNKNLLETCKPLEEYSWFVDRVRVLQKEKTTLEECVDIALSELPDDSHIKPFLLANKAEVKRMCITEYNEKRTLDQKIEEGIVIGEKRGIEIGEKIGIEKGIEKGREEGRTEGIAEGRAEGKEEGRAEGREEGRAEGRAEGREEGRAEGIFETLGSLVEKGYLTLKQAAKEANMTISEFEAKTGLKA